MTLPEIMVMPVNQIAARNSALFLWVTSPFLEHGHQVMKQWGYRYKSSIAWAKERQGIGYWVRNQHELVLIGSRGGFRVAPPKQRSSSLIVGDQRTHSRKPDALHEIIERGWPDARKLELFARQSRRGWAVWGDEAPQECAT